MQDNHRISLAKGWKDQIGLLPSLLLVANVLGGGADATAEVIIDFDTTIDSTIIDNVRIIRGTNPFPPTTVEVVAPAAISGEVRVEDDSVLNITAGTFQSNDAMALSATDSSIVNMYDGVLSSDDDMEFGGTSQLNVYGGILGSEIQSIESSTINVFNGELRDADAADLSTWNIYGGTEAPDLSDSSVLNIYGGLDLVVVARDSSLANVYGGGVILLSAGTTSTSVVHESVITVYGHDFNYDYGPIADDAGTLTGTLLNGDPIEVPFAIYSNASIMLAVPEPASVGLGLWALGISLILFRRSHTAVNPAYTFQPWRNGSLCHILFASGGKFIVRSHVADETSAFRSDANSDPSSTTHGRPIFCPTHVGSDGRGAYCSV